MRKRILTVSCLALVGGWTCLAADAPAPKVEAQPAPKVGVQPAPKVGVQPVAPNARPPMRDRTDFLAQYLGLKEEQKEKLRPVFAEELKKIGELRKETTLSAEERRTKYGEIRQETAKQVKGILTEEQWQKYSERGQRPPTRPPGSPPPVRPAK